MSGFDHLAADLETVLLNMREGNTVRDERTIGRALDAVRGMTGAKGKLIAAAPDLLAALEKAAGWFEDYAKEHYAKALTAPDSREQHGREIKGKTNKDRAAELRAAIQKATQEGEVS